MRSSCPAKRSARNWSTFGTTLMLSGLFLAGCGHNPLPQPSLRHDLRRYGLKTEAPNSLTASYNQIAFLTDNLLLVTINQRTITQPVEPSNVDSPPAKVLLFNITTNILKRSAELPIEKDADSVQAVAGARFVIRNQSGIQVCTADLSCGHPFFVPESGPVLASPAGTSFVAGGYGKTEQILLDGASLSESARFPSGNPVVVPGDGAALLHYDGHRFFIKEDGKPVRALPFTDAAVGDIFLPDSRFLSSVVLGVNESVESLLVAKLDGTPLYRLPVDSWYRGTALISSAAGKRFGLRESNFTRWNSITHFYDIENTRPYDSEKIRLLEVESGKTLFELVRDPRPYINRLTLPALSPDGRHLATIYRGFLEVYEIP